MKFKCFLLILLLMLFCMSCILLSSLEGQQIIGPPITNPDKKIEPKSEPKKTKQLKLNDTLSQLLTIKGLPQVYTWQQSGHNIDIGGYVIEKIRIGNSNLIDSKTLTNKKQLFLHYPTISYWLIDDILVDWDDQITVPFESFKCIGGDRLNILHSPIAALRWHFLFARQGNKGTDTIFLKIGLHYPKNKHEPWNRTAQENPY